MKRTIIIFILSFFLIDFVSSVNQWQKNELIKVSTNNQEMIFKVDGSGKVLFLYWGSIMNDATPFLEYKNKNFQLTDQTITPQLYQPYGGITYIEPALQLTHADGVITTELIFEKVEKISMNENIDHTVITLKDNVYPLYADILFKSYKKENIISQSVSVYHKEDGDIQINKIASTYIPLHANSYHLTYFYGSWGREMNIEEKKLTPGISVIESKRGVRNTQSTNPSFLLSLNGVSGEYSGDVYAGSLAWSGTYKITFECDETNALHIVGGINPFVSTYYIKANEKFTTPEMILSYSNEGRNKITHHFHDWARRYNIKHGDQIRPVVLNSWEGTYFDFDEKKILKMIDDAAILGIELFVLDDGWFGNKYPRNHDNAGLGDWQVNKKKLPRGIKYLAEYAHKKGLKFGIWIEPEMVNPKSELTDNHPDWIVKSGNREKPTERTQWILDLSNPLVQEFVYKSVDNLLSESSHINYIKWDANRYVTNAGSEHLPKDRQSHFWIEYTKGLYNVYERLRAKYPELLMQQCSSGGGRIDFGALKYHDEFWTSDDTNPSHRIFIQHGTNIFYPSIATGAHVSANPNHQTGMYNSLKFRFDVAMSGRLGMELQPADITGSEYDFAKKAIENYKYIRNTVQMGDLYRLVSPYNDTGWPSLMYVSKDKKQAVLFVYNLKFQSPTAFFETQLKGLDTNKNYKIEELNAVENKNLFWGNLKSFTGDYLMKAGINVDLTEPFTSRVFLLEVE